MQVRAKCTHYTDRLRVAGSEWEHKGKLYEHIEPVKGKGRPESADESVDSANPANDTNNSEE